MAITSFCLTMAPFWFAINIPGCTMAAQGFAIVTLLSAKATHRYVMMTLMFTMPCLSDAKHGFGSTKAGLGFAT
jgi:hypothetical protein